MRIICNLSGRALIRIKFWTNVDRPLVMGTGGGGRVIHAYMYSFSILSQPTPPIPEASQGGGAYPEPEDIYESLPQDDEPFTSSVAPPLPTQAIPTLSRVVTTGPPRFPAPNAPPPPPPRMLEIAVCIAGEKEWLKHNAKINYTMNEDCLWHNLQGSLHVYLISHISGIGLLCIPWKRDLITTIPVTRFQVGYIVVS